MKVLRLAQRSMRDIAWLLALLILWLAFVLPVHAKAIEIPLHKRAGVYILPVRINGVITLNFILDSGASEVAIPADVALTLVRTGTIIDSDFLPGKSYRLADGSLLKSTRLILREMEFGGIKISNVSCSVTPSAGDLLLGQSLLERLHSWKLDNDRHTLIVDAVTRTLPDSFGIKFSRARRRTPESTADLACDAAMAASRKGDYATAYKVFKALAEQGYAKAQYYLAVMYNVGLGVPQDFVQGIKWTRKAAEQGYGAAQNDLGVAYYKGWGVPQDYVQAYMWYDLAAAQGEGTQLLRDELIEVMTPDQIAEAQRLAREWKPKAQVGE